MAKRDFVPKLQGTRRAEQGPAHGNLDPEEVARLAYSYWEARGGNGGSPEEDWFQAEDELRLRNGGAK